MDVVFADQATVVEAELPEHAYNHLWDVLERILADPEHARGAPWAKFISTRKLYGSKVPGTDYTVYWKIGPAGEDAGDDDVLQVAGIYRDIGV